MEQIEYKPAVWREIDESVLIFCKKIFGFWIIIRKPKNYVSTKKTT